MSGDAPRRIDVALLAPCYWPEVRRGAERFIRELADGLLADGHRPRLITSHPGLPGRTQEEGLEVLRLWRPPEGRLRRRGYGPYLSHVPLSYAALRAGSDDVAQALHPHDALAAARWTRRTGRPSVFSLMGIASRRLLVSRRRLLNTFETVCRDCTEVVALSQAAARALHRDLGVEPRVIPPGVDIEAFTPGGERHESPTIVCAAAVDEPRKRVGLLIEAFALVWRERPGARLVLDRPKDPEVAQRLSAAGEGIELADLDDRSALASAYRSAWVSALPARGEAFGLVLAEALACGTPGVGTDEGGIPEVLDRPEIGRLVRPGDDEPARLARALLEALELATDPATVAACRRRAEALSTRATTRAYEDLYEELLRVG